jgi:hypothetical protein
MSHWFDRLATWSAEERDDGEEGVFTRRQAVLATAGVGAAGMLGSPLLSRAFGEDPGCDCARAAYRKFDDAANKLEKKYINHGNPFFLPLSAPIFVIAYAGLLTGAYAGQQYHCGVSGADCKQIPSGKPPPPKAQPCTQRGGVRLRGDQCGGDGGGATGGSGCGGGTSSCPTPGGGDLCCFGSDLCCSGCCCIAEVGCGCCG